MTQVEDRQTERPDDGLEDLSELGAMSVLRAGLAATPELKSGLGISVLMALVMAGGSTVIPIAIQQILDRGLRGGDPDWDFILATCAIGTVVMIGLAVLAKLTFMRLMVTAENVIHGLRTRLFAHVHDLSLAHHNESKKGVLVARVTSDIETLSQFASWGAISWVVNSTIIVVALSAIALYSWQLAVLSLLVLVPIIPILKAVQKRQLDAYDSLRSRVADTLSEISETVMGINVIRAYADTRSARGRLDAAIDAQRDAQLRARFFFAVMFPVSDVLSGVLLAVIVGAGVWWGPSWGLQAGSLLAVVFLANMIVQPVAEIGEVLDQTQTALAGWRKALSLLDVEIEVVEPSDGIELSPGALGVKVRDLSFAYEPGRPVLSAVDLEFPVGVNAAIVGETGSGKSTLAKLLVRLVDPTSGSVQIDGIDLRDVAQISRSKAIRLVPQDGFLFEGTIGENVLFGMSNAVEAADSEQAPGSVHAADSDPARAAFDALDLGWWVDSLPLGLDTQVGERGNALSVGERQLVALARAQIADPGLLILDEATSSVDPETERAIADALVKLTEGRTTISIAHRLSTAEAADLVVVFDAGRVVQVGSHDELLAQGGVYGRLHESWVGNTRRS